MGALTEREARVVRAADEALHAAVAGHEVAAVGDEGEVVDAGLGVEQVDPGDVAVAARGGGEAALAALGAIRRMQQAVGVQAIDEALEAGAVAADDHEVGGGALAVDRLDLDAAPASRRSVWRGTAMKPSARQNAVTEPRSPCRAGARSVGRELRGPGETSRSNGACPSGGRAAGRARIRGGRARWRGRGGGGRGTGVARRGGRPASARSSGATNSWKVNSGGGRKAGQDGDRDDGGRRRR